MLILASLVYTGARYNWKIENIIEEIGKVINVKGTSANIEEVAAMDMTKIDLVPDKNKVNVPVPKGYVLSGASDENDVTKGAVIYEGTTAVTDANVAEEKLTRNQFVWVPVSAANVSRIYSEDAYGRKSGKDYTYGDSERKIVVWGKEPYVGLGSDCVEDQDYNVYGYTRNKIYEEMQKNYEETIESIKIYGGFYVGRYETGNLSQKKPVCVQYNEDISNQNWFTMYNKAQYLGGSAGVKSMMLYGSLWHEVIMWLIESKAKQYDEIALDSTNWGNYRNASFQYYNTYGATSTSLKGVRDETKLPTGAKAESDVGDWKRNCVNNIYDLAGNISEATQAGENYFDRYCRGGEYSEDGMYDQAGRGGLFAASNNYDTVGCRVHLIIL